MKPTDRKVFLDVLRIGATCSVVLLHTITGVMDHTDMGPYPLEHTTFLVLMDMITWCVPIFVMISGYLFLAPEKKITFFEMLVKYCKRIVLALFLFGVPYACLEQILVEHRFRLQMVWKAVWMVCTGKSWSHMWYLYMILSLYLVTPLLKKMLSVMPRWMLISLLAVLFVGGSLLPFGKKLFAWENGPVFPDGVIYVFYYICGYLFWCGDHKRKQIEGREEVKQEQSLGKRKKVWCFAAIGALLLGMTCSRLFGNYSVQMAYNYPFTVMLSIFLLKALQSMEDCLAKKNTARLNYLGGLCFTVYLIHPVFLNGLYKGLHFSLLQYPLILSLPVVFLATLFLSFCGAFLLGKIPFLKKYVL